MSCLSDPAARERFSKGSTFEKIENNPPVRSGRDQKISRVFSLALIDLTDDTEGAADLAIMFCRYGLTARPMMDASARDIEQIRQFFPRQTGPPPYFQDSLARRFGHRFNG
jgi:hypothetical protein